MILCDAVSRPASGAPASHVRNLLPSASQERALLIYRQTAAVAITGQHLIHGALLTVEQAF